MEHEIESPFSASKVNYKERLSTQGEWSFIKLRFSSMNGKEKKYYAQHKVFSSFESKNVYHKDDSQ